MLTPSRALFEKRVSQLLGQNWSRNLFQDIAVFYIVFKVALDMKQIIRNRDDAHQTK